MILLPIAKDIEYIGEDQILSFSLIFISKEEELNMNINLLVEDELADRIVELLWTK